MKNDPFILSRLNVSIFYYLPVCSYATGIVLCTIC